MLTCTPVMSGRNQEDKPSPFLAPRPLPFPMDLNYNKEESKGSRTPTEYTSNPLKMITPLFEKYMQKDPKKEIVKEEDFKNDMDEMSDLRIGPYNSKTIPQKCLPVTPGYDKKAPCGFPTLNYKQKSIVPELPKHYAMVNDEDIIPSYVPVPFPKPLSEFNSSNNPFANPFILKYDKDDSEQKK